MRSIASDHRTNVGIAIVVLRAEHIDGNSDIIARIQKQSGLCYVHQSVARARFPIIFRARAETKLWRNNVMIELAQRWATLPFLTLNAWPSFEQLQHFVLQQNLLQNIGQSFVHDWLSFQCHIAHDWVSRRGTANCATQQWMFGLFAHVFSQIIGAQTIAHSKQESLGIFGVNVCDYLSQILGVTHRVCLWRLKLYSPSPSAQRI